MLCILNRQTPLQCGDFDWRLTRISSEMLCIVCATLDFSHLINLFS